MITKHPHIQRKQGIQLAQDLKNAINQPQVSPLLFRVYSKRGVGKKTLVNELNETFSSEFQCPKIFFDLNSPIKTLIDLMTVFDSKLVGDPNEWAIEDFEELKDKHETTCQSLADSAAKEESSDSKEKTIESFKKSTKAAIPGIVTSTVTNPIAG